MISYSKGLTEATENIEQLQQQNAQRPKQVRHARATFGIKLNTKYK